jgi:murein DD-endopeptidase MepM/ murein hydrolase activator NlpD
MIEKKINSHLKGCGLRNRSLRTELTDHFMCSYENHMEESGDIDDALAKVFKEINTNDLVSMNRSYFILNLKNNVYMNLLCFSFSAVLVFFGLGNMIDQDPPSLFPVEHGEVVAEFGERIHPITMQSKMHFGVDIKAKLGTEVLAPEYAVVKETGYTQKKGNYIVLAHDNVYETRFFHLQKIIVDVDQKIEKGAIIGTVGSTGASTAPHLHYEVLKNGKRVNPNQYL